MYLKYLEVHGFKSFPDKIKLEFGKGMTAVVGPNGSGKSNISDAVRWVLGEQSSKTLRGEKMEDVIFGGTQLRRQMGFAQVVLTIGNEDRSLPVDADEIAICRKLYRTGDSEYRINDNAVRLKDVHELFMDTGLGRDGYSMIGQGKIAEIISAKSTQRREIFEEAAGISKYRYRKTEAERKLAQTQENLLRLRDILTELEDRIGPLKTQSEKAKQFVALAEEKKALELSVWIAQLDKMTVQLRELSDQETIGQLAQNQMEEQLEELESQMEQLFSTMQQAGAKMEQLRTEISVLEEQLSSSDSRIAVRKNDIFHNDNTIASLQQEQKNAQLSEESFVQYIAQKEAEKGALQDKEADYISQMELLSRQNDQKQSAFQQVLQDLSDKKDAEARMAFSVSEQKVLQITHQNALTDARERKSVLEEGSSEKGEKRGQVQKELDEYAALLQTLTATLEGLGNSAKGVEMKLQSRVQKEKAILSEKEKLESKVREFHQRASLLEELERNMEGFAHSVKFVLKQSQNGALRGIHGALSSLLQVKPAHLVAIETAVGGALQNIVVEDEITAKRAIGLLQQSQGGRATFLPLSSVKGSRLQVSGLEKCPGFVGIGSDLIGFGERYRGIVESVLGRIVVVDHLDDGIAMAKQYGYKFRIVTLDGQLINAGGSMTGGSTSKSTGLLSRRGEISEMQSKATDFQNQSDSMNADLLTLRQEISALEAQNAGILAEQKTAMEDRIRYESEAKRLQMTLTDLQEDAERSRQQQERLAQQIAQLEEQCIVEQKNQQIDEERLRHLREEISVLEQQASLMREEKERFTSAYNDLLLEKMTVSQQIALLDQSVTEQKSRREDQQKQLQSMSQQIEDLRGANAAIEEEIVQMAANSASMQEEMKIRRDQISQQAALRQQIEGETTALRQREKEWIIQKEKHGGELLRIQDKQASVQKEYDTIISKMWDEYEMTRSEAEGIAHPAEDFNKANRGLNELKGKIRVLGTVNLEAIEEYEQVSQRYTFLSEQIQDVEKSKEKLQQLIYDLTTQMRHLFSESFQQINAHFSQIFEELFGGGKAELKLTEGSDVLESGIDIFVQPPGKIIKNLAALSGGEQAFVAIAIYFAILKVRPAPFCLLDEIEAALDDVNVNKYAEYLRRLNTSTQFIAITHRRGTMEHADVLYGVTMQEEGVSKILALEVSEIENKLGMKNI